MSFSPTISVGRLLCHSKKEIQNYYEKLKLYESYPGRGDTSYLNKGIRVQHQDNFRHSGYGSIFNTLNIKPFDFIDNKAYRFIDSRPYPSDVIQEMSNCGLYSFQCHGFEYGFNIAESTYPTTPEEYQKARLVLAMEEYKKYVKEYQEYNNIGLNMINNYNSPSILYSTACTVALFDKITGYAYNVDTKQYQFIESNVKEYNPASAFTTAGRFGGVAFLGNSREGYWYESIRLEEYFSNSLQQTSCIGIAENISKIIFPEKDSQNGKEIIARHNIIGDPDINLWLGAPSSVSGKESVASGVWTLNATGLKNGIYGISFGNTSLRNTYANANSKVSISLKQAIANNPKAAIGSIFVSEKGCLPYMQLFTTGAQITGQQESYTLVKGAFGSPTDNTYRPVLNLGKNADVTVSAYTDITSDNGITVDDGGNLTMIADGKASFSNDEVKTGGSLTISASKVTIEGGFSVAKGGKLSITPRKEKL